MKELSLEKRILEQINFRRLKGSRRRNWMMEIKGTLCLMKINFTGRGVGIIKRSRGKRKCR